MTLPTLRHYMNDNTKPPSQKQRFLWIAIVIFLLILLGIFGYFSHNL